MATPKKTKASKKPQTSARKNRFKVDVSSMLVNGETVVEQAIIHNGIYWKSFGVLLISIIFALSIAIELGVLLAFVAILMFAHATLRKEILLFTLTNKRIFVRYGILQVDVVDMRFDKIESIELERMIPGYMMSYATLVVMGTGNRYIAIPYVANAREIRRAYNNLTLSDDDLNEKPNEE